MSEKERYPGILHSSPPYSLIHPLFWTIDRPRFAQAPPRETFPFFFMLQYVFLPISTGMS
jgi:hypothetical protein